VRGGSFRNARMGTTPGRTEGLVDIRPARFEDKPAIIATLRAAFGRCQRGAGLPSTPWNGPIAPGDVEYVRRRQFSATAFSR
jgi:hypothetical protein